MGWDVKWTGHEPCQGVCGGDFSVFHEKGLHRVGSLLLDFASGRVGFWMVAFSSSFAFW